MFNVIPEPAQIVRKKGNFQFHENLKLFASPLYQNAVNRLQQFITDHFGYKLDHIPLQDTTATGILIAEKQRPFDAPPQKHAQGYTLTVENDIVICGTKPAGVFYGVMTLIQLLEDSVELPMVEIDDAPKIAMRIEHWDLKGVMPDFAYLKNRIYQLSSLKINTLLIEYEDKFCFEKNPVIVNKHALNSSQVAELIQLASDNYIDVIPLIQSLGHAEYILKHPEYAHVAESQERCQQLCATNPSTLALVKEFCDELLPLHPSKYVHIGGDETRQLGECPACAAVVQEKGKIGLYFDHLKKVCDYIVSLDRIPIIWDDMLCRNFRKDLLEQLPPETVMMPWLYSIKDDKESIFYGPDHTIPYSKEWLKKPYDNKAEMNEFMLHQPHIALNWDGSCVYENIPEDEKKLFQTYVEIEESPKYFNATPAIPLLKDAGLSFIGAGAALASSDGNCLPFSENKIDNLKAWSKIITANNGLGIVATEWARSGTLTAPNAPFETRWHAVAALAEFSWTGGKTDDKDYDRKFNWRFFGIDGLSLTDALFFLRNPDDRYSGVAVKMLEAVSENVTRNQPIFDNILNAAKLVYLNLFFNRVWNICFKSKYYLIKAGQLHKSQKKELVEIIGELTNMITPARQKTEILLSAYMPTGEVAEYLASFFMPLDDFISFMNDSIEC